MTWEVALAVAASSVAYSFIYVGCNMGMSISEDQTLVMKYLGFFLIALGFWTLSALPVIGHLIIDATTSLAAATAFQLHNIMDGTFKVLIRISVLLFSLFFVMLLWDVLKVLITRKRTKQANEANGDFS